MTTPEPFVVTDLSALVLPSDRYTVLSAVQSQMLGGPEGLIDSVEISFSVTGRAGVFTVELPVNSFAVFEFGIDLTSEAAIVEAIYNL